MKTCFTTGAPCFINAGFGSLFLFNKQIYSILFLFFVAVSSGKCQWANKMGSTGPDYGQSVVTDKNGNVFVTGTFTGIADFDPGPAVFNLQATCPCSGASPNYDIFLAKYNSSGSFLWAFKLGATQRDLVNAIAADSSGNIYITGEFWLTVDFDPGAGIKNLVSPAGNAIFLAKYQVFNYYAYSVVKLNR